MSKVYISEHASLVMDYVNGHPVAALQEPSTEQTPITSSGVSQQSSAFGASTRIVRIHTDGIVSIAFGTNPTATTNSKRLAANQTEYFGVAPDMKVAVIDNT